MPNVPGLDKPTRITTIRDLHPTPGALVKKYQGPHGFVPAIELGNPVTGIIVVALPDEHMRSWRSGLNVMTYKVYIDPADRAGILNAYGLSILRHVVLDRDFGNSQVNEDQMIIISQTSIGSIDQLHGDVLDEVGTHESFPSNQILAYGFNGIGYEHAVILKKGDCLKVVGNVDGEPSTRYVTLDQGIAMQTLEERLKTKSK